MSIFKHLTFRRLYRRPGNGEARKGLSLIGGREGSVPNRGPGRVCPYFSQKRPVPNPGEGLSLFGREGSVPNSPVPTPRRDLSLMGREGSVPIGEGSVPTGEGLSLIPHLQAGAAARGCPGA